jgi:hypothetical protein
MPFLFFTCHALSLAEAVTGGESRIVRSPRPRCRFFLASAKFARPRYRFERATSASCPDEVAVAIDVHGSEDQVKDACSAGAREARFRVSQVRCMRFEECMRTSFPSSAPSGHPLSPVRHREGRRPVLVAGPNQDLRSDVVPRRPTPSRRPGCLPPLRPRRAFDRRIAPPTESRASVPRSRRPHVLHWLWRGAFTGLASARVRSPAIPGNSRNRPPFLPMGSILSNLSCLGLTTQARPSARPSWLVCES